MGKSSRCDCGYELKARGEKEQVAEIRRHALDAHGVAFSAEEALLVLMRSELESSGESLLKSAKEGEDR